MATIAGRMIQSLLRENGSTVREEYSEQDVMSLVDQATTVISQQPTFLELDPPLLVCGDVHGQFKDLMRIFKRGGFPPMKNYLFLGDYVDRGPRQLDTICLLLAYKVLYPANFFLLRGNHECAGINRVYGFYDELLQAWGHAIGVRLWQHFQLVFNWMPPAAMVADKLLCMHGGISPHLNNFDQLRHMERPIDPQPGRDQLLMDLLWSDPDKTVTGWMPNNRGISHVFGPDVAENFCEQMEIDIIVRAHQLAQYGYDFPFDNGRVLTIFSAPQYYDQHDNAGAMLTIGIDLRCSFHIFRPNRR